MATRATEFLRHAGEEEHSLEDYAGRVPRWCTGCGDLAILTAVQRVCRDEQLPLEKIVFVSGKSKLREGRFERWRGKNGNFLNRTILRRVQRGFVSLVTSRDQRRPQTITKVGGQQVANKPLAIALRPARDQAPWSRSRFPSGRRWWP